MKKQPFQLFDKPATGRQPPHHPTGHASHRLAAGHKYKIGQALVFSATGLGAETRKGTYQVVSLMPVDSSGENQYRVKSLFDVHERVVRESQLSAG